MELSAGNGRGAGGFAVGKGRRPLASWLADSSSKSAAAMRRSIVRGLAIHRESSRDKVGCLIEKWACLATGCNAGDSGSSANPLVGSGRGCMGGRRSAMMASGGVTSIDRSLDDRNEALAARRPAANPPSHWDIAVGGSSAAGSTSFSEIGSPLANVS
jgi:hypothetical protein